jgi:hypothetical protein
MSRIWKEPKSSNPTLIPEWVYFVNVCSFTFKFDSVDQIKLYIDFYSRKIHPTSRVYVGDEAVLRCHRYQVQRWYERLPLYLRKEGKRQRVVKALEQALEKFADEKNSYSKNSKNE